LLTIALLQMASSDGPHRRSLRTILLLCTSERWRRNWTWLSRSLTCSTLALQLREQSGYIRGGFVLVRFGEVTKDGDPQSVHLFQGWGSIEGDDNISDSERCYPECGHSAQGESKQSQSLGDDIGLRPEPLDCGDSSRHQCC